MLKGKGQDTCYSTAYKTRDQQRFYNLGSGSWLAWAHPLPALTDNWTQDAASRHIITPISHTRPSPCSRSYHSFPVLVVVACVVCGNANDTWWSFFVRQQLHASCFFFLRNETFLRLVFRNSFLVKTLNWLGFGRFVIKYVLLHRSGWMWTADLEWITLSIISNVIFVFSLVRWMIIVARQPAVRRRSFASSW